VCDKSKDLNKSARDETKQVTRRKEMNFFAKVDIFSFCEMDSEPRKKLFSIIVTTTTSGGATKKSDEMEKRRRFFQF